MPTELNCSKCSKSLQKDEVFSFKSEPLCESCYMTEKKLGPLSKEYIECPSCGKVVHRYTIKCPSCGTQIHKTGTIRVQKPISSTRIFAYGISALLLVVIAFTIPSFSSKGFVTWFAALFGVVFALHGMLGIFFGFIPYGLVTPKSFKAFGLGFLETALGIFLVYWPML